MTGNNDMTLNCPNGSNTKPRTEALCELEAGRIVAKYSRRTHAASAARRWSIGFAAAIAVAAFTMPAARAGLLNVHISDEIPPALWTDPTPVNPADPSQGWNWPNPPWSINGPAVLLPDGLTIEGMLAGPIVIGANKERLFGMDNFFVPTNVKTYTVEFDYLGGSPHNGGGGNFGYHPASNFDGGFLQGLSVVDTGNHFKVEMVINPQPDWEYIYVYNNGPGAMTISNVMFRSVCVPVPEPATVGLLALGLLIRLPWRRRGRPG